MTNQKLRLVEIGSFCAEEHNRRAADLLLGFRLLQRENTLAPNIFTCVKLAIWSSF
jgi:hypothetical protein